MLKGGSGRRPRLLFAAGLVGASLAFFAGPAAADTPPPIPAGASWLTTVNFYRAMAGLGAVTENATWSAGDLKHSKYVAEQSWITHAEDPCSPPMFTDDPFPACVAPRVANPYYTTDGDAAGRNGNVFLGFGAPAVTCPDRQVVEGWVAGPFHALGILDPKLQTSGFASYISVDNSPGQNCGATLDVLRGLTGAAPGAPVPFPGNGMTTPLLSYGGGESPDPLSNASCAGFTIPTGPPILLQLTATPVATAVTLTDNGAAMQNCFYDETTYTNPNAAFQSLGRGVLAQRHAIVIMPRTPLTTMHVYAVDVQTGTAFSPDAIVHTTWSFTACAAGQTGGTCSPTAVTFRDASAVPTSRGNLVRWRTAWELDNAGFNVYRLEGNRRVRLNARLIVASTFGTFEHRYSVLDRRGTRSSRYLIEDLDTAGRSRWHGPVLVPA